MAIFSRGCRLLPTLGLMALLASPALAETANPAAPASGETASAVPAVGSAAGVTGPVKIQRVSKPGEWADLTAGAALQTGDRIKTLGGGKAKLRFIDESVVTLGENSELRVRKVEAKAPRRNTLLELVGGKVRALVSKFFTDTASTYQINTGTAVAGVRGTEYVVLAKSKDESEVVVLEGEVQVSNIFDKARAFKMVKAGEYVLVIGEQPPTDPTPADAERLNQLRDGTSLPDDEEEAPGEKGAMLEIPALEMEAPEQAAPDTAPDNVLPQPKPGDAIGNQALQPPTLIEPDAVPHVPSDHGPNPDETDVDIKPGLPNP